MALLMHLRFPSCIKVGCLCRMPIFPPIWCSFPCHVDIVRNWPVTRISAALGSVAMVAWAHVRQVEVGDEAQLPQDNNWQITWMVAPRKIRKLATLRKRGRKYKTQSTESKKMCHDYCFCLPDGLSCCVVSNSCVRIGLYAMPCS